MSIFLRSIVRFRDLLIEGAMIFAISDCVTRPIPMTSIGYATPAPMIDGPPSSRLSLRQLVPKFDVFWKMLRWVDTNWLRVCMKSNPSRVVSSWARSIF